MTVWLRRMIQREAGPHCSEQGITLCVFHISSSSHVTVLSSSAQLHYSRSSFEPPVLSLPVSHLALRSVVLSCFCFSPSSRSYRLFLTSSHTLSALYLLQPLSSLLKILWFCLMIDEPHLIAYTWLLCHPSFSESVYMCSSAVLWLDVGTDQVRAPSVALYWRCLWSWVGHMRRDMLNNRVYFRCIGDKVECIKRPPVCGTLKAELR